MFLKHVYVKNVGVIKKLWKMIKVALSNKILELILEELFPLRLAFFFKFNRFSVS